MYISVWGRQCITVICKGVPVEVIQLSVSPATSCRTCHTSESAVRGGVGGGGNLLIPRETDYVNYLPRRPSQCDSPCHPPSPAGLGTRLSLYAAEEVRCEGSDGFGTSSGIC